MMKWLFRSRGQIAPLLIAIIVILLIATMVTVNIGKLSLLKTGVSNAADAGALAGASAMATGLSHGMGNIGFHSDSMLADWAAAQATLLFCPNCVVSWVVYGSHVASQGLILLMAQERAEDVVGDKGEAEIAAKQLAFSNSGIDEAKKIRKNETYEEYLKRKSPFERWMEDEEYKDEDSYTWDDDLKYGQTESTQPNRVNSVTVKVEVPSWGIVPLPGIIWFLGTGCKVHCCCFCYCGPLGTTWGIAAVTGSEDPIKVKVTGVKPGTNLGLWKTKYKTTSGGDITSSAEAEAYGGSVLPVGSDYDSKLTKTE